MCHQQHALYVKIIVIKIRINIDVEKKIIMTFGLI